MAGAVGKSRFWSVAMAVLLCNAQPVYSETEPPSAPDQPAESLRRADQPGVYLRLGVGLDEPERSRYRDDTCSSINPPALFGCVNGDDGRPLGARGSFDSTVVLDTALGYRFLPWLRAEALLSWRPSMDFKGQSNFIGAGDHQPVWGSVSSLAGFGVAYVDLPPIGSVQPFLGAGVGAAHNQMGAMRYSFPALPANASTTTPDGSRTNLAYLLTAGLSVPIGDRLNLDFAYRYTDLGQVQTNGGEATVVRARGTRRIDIGGTHADLQSHGAMISLRYAF
ncbi:MAG: outer membrane beta-barrel protein [Cyanobacteriota bacterium]|nr:outer membrane beta-barrel protein [Cyanobacteriota bacterium]